MDELDDRFSRLCRRFAHWLGSSYVFALTVMLIFGWAIGGFFHGFDSTYHLWANTISTLATSIFVVLIQNAQNSDTKALHAKIDELVRAVPQADNRFIHYEEQQDDEMPPRGPSNLQVRSSNPLPMPKDVNHQ